jgi:hypothetical protein
MQQPATARDTLCHFAGPTDTEMRHIRALAKITSVLAALAVTGAARDARADDAPAAETPAPSDAPPSQEIPPNLPAEPITPPRTPGNEPAPGAPTDPTTNDTGKRIGVGVDALLVAPVGDFAESTGPLAGPVLRFGYRVIPLLEIALRAGYLFGTKKTRDGVLTKIDVLPLWVGARLFMWKPFVGPYAALEAGMNSLLPTVDPPPTTPSAERQSELRRRFGANIGFGYLISQDVPVDVRAQVMLLNLIGRSDDLSETMNVGVSLGAGYTLQF